jgi:heat shock protein HslJ
MKRLILFAGIALCILGACNSTKKTPSAAEITLEGTYWRLTELMGKPVPKESAMKKESFIMLDKTNTRVSASGGCNVLGGSYAVEDGNRIKFSAFIGTQMACPDMEIEQQLLKALEQADNYNITGSNLILNKARMAPLARFEAAQQPK